MANGTRNECCHCEHPIKWQLKLGGNFLLEPAAAMVHMLSLVMYALCSPCSLTNKWDTEVPYTRKIAILSTVAMVTQVWNPCAPLLLCTVGSDTQVWNPCAPLQLSHYCAL